MSLSPSEINELRSSLPNPTGRMFPKSKVAILQAISHGVITREEAMKTYNLSEEELSVWEGRFQKHGKSGLMVGLTSTHRSQERFGH